MATHDYVLDNATGANFRSDLNNALAAIVSNNSSPNEPGTKYAYQWWADTTTGILKIRNSANDGWVELLQLDGTLTLEDGSASSPALAFRDDLNTGIYSSAADKFNVATGGVERMELGSQTVFNEDGADVDFRIEGDTDANLFYVDAGNDRIGITTNSPEELLDLGNDVQINLKIGGRCYIGQAFSTAATILGHSVKAKTTGTTSGGMIVTETNSGGGAPSAIRMQSGNIEFHTAPNGTADADFNSNEHMRIDSNGRLAISLSTARASGGVSGMLQVERADGNGAINIVQNQNNAAGSPSLVLAKSRGTSVGSNTVVANNDTLGSIKFAGADGTDLNTPAAQITGQVDGTPGSNDMPGRLVFSTTADGATSSTERMRIGSDGDCGIGTTSPSARLDVFRSNDNNTACIITNNGTTGGHGLKISSGGTGVGSNVLSVHKDNQSGDDETFRVDGAGNKFMDGNNTTTDANKRKSYFVANGQQIHARNAHEAYIVFQKNDGTQIGSIARTVSNVAYNTSSDYRLKENVSELSNGITRLKQLKPSRFNFISDPDITMDGFIAHEVSSVVPEAIEGEKDGVITQAMLDAGTLTGTVGDPIYQGIDQSKLVPLLVAAVQELITKVETLEAA